MNRLLADIFNQPVHQKIDRALHFLPVVISYNPVDDYSS
ncbi:hypothetical protein SD77_0301 [Bacillus badius]|uniref:Uncharacterized protein n=1 Tax=Bacillus badius TaxID=1455 RepID=A0ABR5B0E5_BACBA|nr:hypothetical protein SD78_3632 [Bacillus badius]KIL80453.1 hypothetical protein SD77_0301 [Bacillus badius]